MQGLASICQGISFVYFTQFPGSESLLINSFSKLKSLDNCCQIMASLPRPASALVGKKHSMRPPIARPTTARTQSSASSLHGRPGAASPAESVLSTSTDASHPKSPAKISGIKRKERECDADGGEETNINVVVRCRGRNDREVRENSGVVVSTDRVRGKSVELSMGPSALSNKTYHFDKVFSPAADQSMMYDDVVTPILDEVSRFYPTTQSQVD